MMRKVITYSAAHFAVDFACASLMLSLPVRGAEAFPLCLLLYNFSAFALQMPFGVMTDKLNRNAAVAAVGCLMVLLSAAFRTGEYAAFTAAAIAGAGNALFHIGAGVDVLNTKRISHLGLFVAPGALGLFFGGVTASSGNLAVIAGCAAALAAGILICVICKITKPSGNAPFSITVGRKTKSPLVLVAIALFVVVVIRSYAGTIFAFSWKTGQIIQSLLIVFATAGGKALGGIVAERTGSRLQALMTLLPAAILFLLADNSTAAVVAVLLFNMTMPVTLSSLAEQMPGAKGLSFGILTFALFLGYIPSYLELPMAFAYPMGWSLLSLVSLALLLPFVPGRKKL